MYVNLKYKNKKKDKLNCSKVKQFLTKGKKTLVDDNAYQLKLPCFKVKIILEERFSGPKSI